MEARHLMTQPVITVHADTCLADVARTIVEASLGCVPVVDGKGRLCGIITQSDFDDNQKGASLFDRGLVTDVRPGEPFWRRPNELGKKPVPRWPRGHAHGSIHGPRRIPPWKSSPQQMLRYDIDHIPVVRDGVPVGMVARHDFLRLVAAEAQPR